MWSSCLNPSPAVMICVCQEQFRCEGDGTSRKSSASRLGLEGMCTACMKCPWSHRWAGQGSACRVGEAGRVEGLGMPWTVLGKRPPVRGQLDPEGSQGSACPVPVETVKQLACPAGKKL